MATTKRTARKTARTVRKTGRKVARATRKTGRKTTLLARARTVRKTGRRWRALPARQDGRWHALPARQDVRWQALPARRRERSLHCQLLHNPSSSLSEEPRPYPPGFFFGNCRTNRSAGICFQSGNLQHEERNTRLGTLIAQAMPGTHACGYRKLHPH